MIKMVFYFLCIAFIMDTSVNLWFSGELKFDMVSYVMITLLGIFGYLTYKKGMKG